ncbi:hypothetical protein JCM10213_008908 [Rhodosporidiobolus nylandii]
MDRSAHPYAQTQELPRQSPSGLPTTTPRRPPSAAGLPPLPGELHGGAGSLPSHRLPAASTSAAALAHSSSHPDLYQAFSSRQRGESTPVSSRHSNRADPFDSLPLDAAAGGGQGKTAVVRRQSSGLGGGTVSRRIVVGEDGKEREETREERRARKERERAARADGVDGRELSRARLSDGIDFSSASLGAPPMPSASLSARPGSSAGSIKDPSPTSSKSVLTIALQRAQSAVLLDSANNFPAAIAAYAQSVRLLKEVMARVQDGSREMERKLSEGGVRPGESADAFEARKLRYEKKEKAKMDEARRLRVIHDTYEDRIRMLVQMGTPLPPNFVLSPSLHSLASAAGPPSEGVPSHLPTANGTSSPRASPSLPSNPSFPDATYPGRTASPQPQPRPPSLVYRRHRSDREEGERVRSISSLREVSTPPTTFATPPYLSPQLGQDRERASSAAAEGIGAAMLSASVPSSPAEAARLGAGAGAQQRLPQIETLPVFSPMPLGGMIGLGVEGMADDQTLLAVGSPAEGLGQRRPPSIASDTTATAPSTATATAYPSPLPSTSTSTAQPSPLANAAPLFSSHQHSRSADNALLATRPPFPKEAPHLTALPPSQSNSSISSTSSGSREDQPLRSALDHGEGWPSSAAADSEAREATEDLAPLPSTSLEERRPSFASLAMRRGSSASAITTASDSTMRAIAMHGGESMSMRRTASAQSSSTLDIRPRPSRSASLASSAAMAPSASGGSVTSTGSATSQAKQGLVNASVAEGTISQRRMRSPTPSEGVQLQAPLPSALPSSNIIVRAPSSEVDRTSAQYAQLPLPPPPMSQARSAGAAGGGGFSASSLPGRLRALSQPGSKRPKLQSFDSEQPPPRPPLPPLLSNVNRSASAMNAHAPSASVSSSSGSASRKGSVPTPTSLYAPQAYPALGRSNSSSSIGSSASSAYRAERAAQANGTADTPTSSFFSGTGGPGSKSPVTSTQHHSHPSQSGGVYLSAGLPSPPASSSPSSREATASIPPARRPFHLMRLLVATIPSSSSSAGSAAPNGGGYLSEKLFVPAQIWTTQGGAKLVAIETKVRMLDLLCTGLDGVEKAGKGLLLVPTHSLSAQRVAKDEAARFARELESFEGLAEGIQSTLGKKLGQGVIGAPGGGVGGGVGGAAPEKDPKTGRKGSTASFSAWSSKLSMSLNRVTNGGASLDSQATYVDAIAKVFKQAQCLDHHLSLLFPSPSAPLPPSFSSPSSPTLGEDSNPYLLLPPADRHRLERQLRKASEFFAMVVCRFVMRDTGVLLDKYVKRGGAWLSGE